MQNYCFGVPFSFTPSPKIVFCNYYCPLKIFEAGKNKGGFRLQEPAHFGNFDRATLWTWTAHISTMRSFQQLSERGVHICHQKEEMP